MTDSDIDITNLPKHRVLQALFNASRQRGIGLLDRSGVAPLSTEDAKEIVSSSLDFDYVRGRVFKVNISGDCFDPWLFDRNNGQGAAERAISALREEG